jgi:hypothetical protein
VFIDQFTYLELVPLLPVEEIQDRLGSREGKIGVRLLNLQLRDGKFEGQGIDMKHSPQGT